MLSAFIAIGDGMIRAGIGGWTFEPWRGGNFFPKGLAKTRELEFASRKVTTIEINGTYYSSQKPASFKRWHDDTPDDFIFAVKAIRFATNRRVLAEAGESVMRFVESGLSELKHKLGPILWQFMPTKKFEAADFGEFLSLLPEKLDGRKLRHAVEVRHESFVAPEFVALARKFGVAIVLADSARYPMIADVTADFVYARLQNAQAKVPTGYTPAAIDKWMKRAQSWQSGDGVCDLPTLGKAPAKKKRDVFVYMINGAKERAPAAAMAFLEKLK
jgi:uncharacterized protein YecE (DUF72 family)